jgi:hypothetical protein
MPDNRLTHREKILKANLVIQFQMLDCESPEEVERLRRTLRPVPPPESDAVHIGKILPGVLRDIKQRMEQHREGK